MNRRTGAFRYGLFALPAAALNIGIQRLALLLFPGERAIWPAIGAGTLAGLAVKFVLDSRFVFSRVPSSAAAGLRVFIAYCSLSLVSSVVFWAVELAFHALSGWPNAKYVGAAVGLALGYTLKFHLDSRFVFARRSS